MQVVIVNFLMIIGFLLRTSFHDSMIKLELSFDITASTNRFTFIAAPQKTIGGCVPELNFVHARDDVQRSRIQLIRTFSIALKSADFRIFIAYLKIVLHTTFEK